MTLSRFALSAAVFAALVVAAPAADPKPAPTLRKQGSVADESLEARAPASGVLVTAKQLETLRDAWLLGELPKIDFDKELVVVTTTRGSILRYEPEVRNGNLTTFGLSTRDLRDGFRYVLVSVPRAGIKTVNGKPIPKE